MASSLSAVGASIHGPTRECFGFVSWPGSGFKRMAMLAAFGASPSRFQTCQAPLCFVDPPRADLWPLANADEIEGKIAVVSRGGCSFLQKAQRVQLAGARAMILINNPKEEPFAMFQMGASQAYTIQMQLQHHNHNSNDTSAPTSAPTLPASGGVEVQSPPPEELEVVIPCVMMCLHDVRVLFRTIPPQMPMKQLDKEVTVEIVDSVQTKHWTNEYLLKRQQEAAPVTVGAGAVVSGGDSRHHQQHAPSPQDPTEGNHSKWGLFRRTTSSLMKYWEPQASATPCTTQTLAQPPKDPSFRDQQQEQTSPSPRSTDSNGSNRCEDTTKQPHGSSDGEEPEEETIGTPSEHTTPCRQGRDSVSAQKKTPLFGFVQWSTNSETYRMEFAPLSDFCVVQSGAVYQAKPIVCDPLLANEPVLRNGDKLCGQIALVLRGECTFPEKLDRIQRCGALAAIVGNNDKENPGSAFVMSVDRFRVDHLVLPSVMVSNQVFEALQRDKPPQIRIVCLSAEAASLFLMKESKVWQLDDNPRGDGDESTAASDPSSKLHRACLEGDLKSCQDVLDTMLASSSTQGTMKTREELVNRTDGYQWTPLHYACAGGHAEIVSLLLRNGAHPIASDLAMQTPLHLACMASNAAIVKSLIQACASGISMGFVTQANLGDLTPLHYAARSGSTECIELLLSVNARVEQNGKYVFDGVDLQDKDGRTPLHLACINAHAECAMYLIAANAKLDVLDAKGASPLQIACMLVNDAKYAVSSLHIIEKLITAGADLRERTAGSCGEQGEDQTATASDRLLIDRVESKALRRELELVYLRREVHCDRLEIDGLRRQIGDLQQQLDMAQDTTSQMMLEHRRTSESVDQMQHQMQSQEKQIAQLHQQMQLMLQILQSSPNGELGSTSLMFQFAPAISMASSTASSVSSSSAASLASNPAMMASLSRLSESQVNRDTQEQELAEEAALARDIAKKHSRNRNFRLAELFFEKSIELFPLPGVKRMLEVTRQQRQQQEQLHQQQQALQLQHQANQTSSMTKRLGKALLIQRFEDQLTNAKAPQNVIESIHQELEQLKLLEEGSSEYQRLSKWLEWLCALPWNAPAITIPNASASSGLLAAPVQEAIDDQSANAMSDGSFGMRIFKELEQMQQQAALEIRHRAARVIQRQFRERFAVPLLQKANAATRIQCLWRGWLARKAFQGILEQHRTIHVRQDSPIAAKTNGSPVKTQPDETPVDREVGIDFAREIDPFAVARLTKNGCYGRRDPGCVLRCGLRLEQQQSPSMSTEFCVVQLLQTENPIRSNSLFKTSNTSSTNWFYVWTRWGKDQDEHSECCLKGEYDQMYLAQQEFTRLVQEKFRRGFKETASIAPMA